MRRGGGSRLVSLYLQDSLLSRFKFKITLITFSDKLKGILDFVLYLIIRHF